MFGTDQHTRLTAIIAALLLALSSSGFTAVLHSCLMAEKSCCGLPLNMMAGTPLNDAEGAADPTLTSNMSCCAVTVAGGLNTNPIVSGTQQTTPQHLDLISLLPPSVLSGAQDIHSHPIHFASSAAASPPSVEKYVLNASFLI